MNKADLVAAIAAEAGLTKVQAQGALEATVKAISEALQKGESVQLPSHLQSFPYLYLTACYNLAPAIKLSLVEIIYIG